MDADEREIYYYLKGFRTEFVAAREICRRAGGKSRYRDDPEWAKPLLNQMYERGILESDGTSHFRLKPRETRQALKRWVSPQIAAILKTSSSGAQFEQVIMIEDDTDEQFVAL